jgi:hypothetical protein
MTILHEYWLKLKHYDLPLEQEVWQGLSLLRAAWFCGVDCVESHAGDRRLGLIYGSVLMEFDSGNAVIMDHHDSCRWTHRCPYCGADMPEGEG